MAISTTHEYKEIDDPSTNSKQVFEHKVVTTSPSTPVVYRPNLASQIIYYVLDVVEIILALRLIFRLFIANPGNPFVTFIYALTAPLVAPFRGIFYNTNSVGVYFEWATVIAMIIYALIAYIIVRLIELPNNTVVER